MAKVALLLFAVSVAAVLAAVAEAKHQHRREHDSDRRQDYDDDKRRSSNEIDSERDSEESHHRHHRHHHHDRHHHHGRHHHDEESQSAKASRRRTDPLVEMKEFRREFLKTVRRLAHRSDLSSDDTDKLVEIFEENWTEMKVEDRSEWTEEQWQRSKEAFEKRKESTRKDAFDAIDDHEHLTVFFHKLQIWKKLMKATHKRRFELLVIRLAERSGLTDEEVTRFLVQLDMHEKPKGVHHRPGMSENEKAKNLAIYKRNWQSIKKWTLRGASERSQEHFERLFRSIERYFHLKQERKSRNEDDDESQRMRRRHRRHGLSRFAGRRHSRRHHSRVNDDSSRENN